MEYKEFNGRTVNILGTEYEIYVHKVSEDKVMRNNNLSGYCNKCRKQIIVGDVNEKKFYDFDTEEGKREYFYLTLRHEIIHAFLYESGLSSKVQQGWAINEEMIDWYAMQSPKILKVYQELNCL